MIIHLEKKSFFNWVILELRTTGLHFSDKKINIFKCQFERKFNLSAFWSFLLLVSRGEYYMERV
jgi:hypothetical protein